MKKKIFGLILLFLFTSLILFGRTVGAEDKTNYFYSPFTGLPARQQSLQKAVMIVIENSPMARPQSGLNDASIVYEYLVEGGITRFLALYWKNIPDKMGPIRSARPYLIKTAKYYNSLLLHAGASPDGFKMLQNNYVTNLDQIYNGNYYWRSSNRKTPHNLYTGFFKIKDYLGNLTGQEYNPRFNFQQISFVNPEKIEAEQIKIKYWGNYKVLYRYNSDMNNYHRFLDNFDKPHMTGNSKHISVNNIIIKFVDTKVKDDQGRLTLKNNGKGKGLLFRDGTVKELTWENSSDNWTYFYNKEKKRIKVNPGKTWIQVVPQSTSVDY